MKKILLIILCTAITGLQAQSIDIAAIGKGPHEGIRAAAGGLIAIEDFRQFTSQDDMIKKLALPILDNSGNIIKPTEISIVKVPAGTKVRKSVARAQDWPGQGHQPGGSVQFEIRDNSAIPQSWFKPMGNISDYLN